MFFLTFEIESTIFFSKIHIFFGFLKQITDIDFEFICVYEK